MPHSDDSTKVLGRLSKLARKLSDMTRRASDTNWRIQQSDLDLLQDVLVKVNKINRATNEVVTFLKSGERIELNHYIRAIHKIRLEMSYVNSNLSQFRMILEESTYTDFTEKLMLCEQLIDELKVDFNQVYKVATDLKAGVENYREVLKRRTHHMPSLGNTTAAGIDNKDLQLFEGCLQLLDNVRVRIIQVSSDAEVIVHTVDDELDQQYFHLKKRLEHKWRLANLTEKDFDTFKYNVDKKDGILGNGIGCYITILKNTNMAKEKVTCTQQIKHTYPGVFGPKVCLISNCVKLKTVKNKTVYSEVPVTISMPYHLEPKDLDTLKSPMARVRVGKGEWTSLEAHFGVAEGEEVAKFQLDELKHDTICLVVYETITCQIIVAEQGGNLVPENDDSVVMTISPGTFDNYNLVTLKSIPIEQDIIERIQREHPDLEGTSSLIYPSVPHSAAKPVEVSLGMSSGHKQRVFLIGSTDAHRWRPQSVSAKLYDGRKCVAEIPAGCKKVLAVVTDHDLGEKEKCDLAKSIESKLQEHLVNFIMRQRSDEDDHIVVECCLRENVRTRIQDLTNMGFTKGPSESIDLYVNEGSRLLFNCSDTLTWEDGTSEKKLTFYSKLDRARHDGYVMPISFTKGFCSGKIRLHVPTKFLADSELKLVGHAGDATCLAELSFRIKGDSGREAPGRYFAVRSEGLLSTGYFEELARKLFNEQWLELALALGLTGPAIEYLKQQSPNSVECAVEMLLRWFKTSKIASNKVVILSDALLAIDRRDLSEDLMYRDVTMTKDRAFYTVWKIMIKHPVVLQKWKMFLLELNLSESDILEIEHKDSCNKSLSDCLREGINLWRERKGREADIQTIVEVLRTQDNNRAADYVEDFLKRGQP